jgi:hypothetical protein
MWRICNGIMLLRPVDEISGINIFFSLHSLMTMMIHTLKTLEFFGVLLIMSCTVVLP